MKRFAIIVLIIAGLQCQPAVVRAPLYQGDIKAGAWMKNIPLNYEYNGEKKQVALSVYFPKTYVKGKNFRTLIALHGYEGTANQWGDYTGLGGVANKYNFIIVCPAMGKALYESTFYPETKSRWDSIPSGKFIATVLIPYLRNNFMIALDRERTGIFGNSTGGRGALLMAALHTDMFGAAAGLSGDYDPLAMTNDKLLTEVYGPYEKFKERWANDDNIIKLAVNLKNTPILLGHGEIDYTIPIEQSALLVIRLMQLKKKQGGYSIDFHRRRYRGHDWAFWGSMVPTMLEFFNAHLKE